jgi:hypothetical protein
MCRTVLQKKRKGENITKMGRGSKKKRKTEGKEGKKGKEKEEGGKLH